MCITVFPHFWLAQFGVLMNTLIVSIPKQRKGKMSLSIVTASRTGKKIFELTKKKINLGNRNMCLQQSEGCKK